MQIQNSANKAGSLKMNTALEYSTRAVQEGGHRCKKSTLNDLVHALDPSKNTFNEPTYRQVTDNMYLVGRDPHMRKGAAYIYGAKSVSGMMQFWPLQGSPQIVRSEV